MKNIKIPFQKISITQITHWGVLGIAALAVGIMFLNLVPTVYGAPTQISTCRTDGCTLTIPRQKVFMSLTDPNTVWAMFEKSSGNFMKTTDGGATWSTPITVRSWLDYHASLSGDGAGNIYVTDPGSGNVYFRKINSPAVATGDMATSITLSSAFTPAGVATRSNVLAQDENNIWVFYRTSINTTGNVRYFHSTDGGATFPNEGWVSNTGYENVRIGSLLINGLPAVVIWYSDDSSNVGWGYKYFIWDGAQFVANADSSIVWGSKVYRREYAMSFVNNEFHVIYPDNSNHLIHSWKEYNNGTGSWNQSTIVSLPYNPSDWHPSLTRHGDTLYLFYIKQESTTADNNNVYYRKWDTTAHVWTDPVAVTTDGLANKFPTGPAVANPTADYIPIIWSTSGPVVMYTKIPTNPGVACTEAWSCTDWSVCANSTQTRACSDTNNCGTTEQKPAESQACQNPAIADTTPPATVTNLTAE